MQLQVRAHAHRERAQRVQALHTAGLLLPSCMLAHEGLW